MIISRKTSKKGVLLITLVILFAGLTLLAKKEFFYETDLAFSTYIQRIIPEWLIPVFGIISYLEVLLTFTVLGLTIYYIKKRMYVSAIFTFLSGMSFVVNAFLKHTISISRPEESIISPLYKSYYAPYSSTTIAPLGFPSGHVFNYVVIWGWVLTLIGKKDIQKSSILKVIRAFLLILILMVGLSRIVLGAHFLSQVVAGYVLGYLWLVILRMGYDYVLKKRTQE